jgi:hypothetical protein
MSYFDIYFRLDFRLVFPVLSVENLYLGTAASPISWLVFRPEETFQAVTKSTGRKADIFRFLFAFVKRKIP